MIEFGHIAIKLNVMHRIHIVGASPRSGTTLIAEAMIACFEIDVYCEHEARVFADAPHAGEVFLTKAPRDILLAAEALEENPLLHIVYMLRDPRNIVVSKHRRAPGRYWAGLKFWKLYTPIGRALKAHPRFITLRYEDLLADPDAVQDELATRLSFLRKRAPFSRYHEVAKPSADATQALSGVRPILAARDPGWRAHLPRLVAQLEMHGPLTQDLIEFGYEKDAQWLRELDGIEADRRPSFWPEFFTTESLARLRQR